ncbi:MAG: RidA family protein, partial [Proteobacteria bacterium]|nr:RidA family protein [Pseudomonadota bacterium]
QIGWTPQEKFETDAFAGQVRQALLNVVAVLAAGGVGPEHLVRMTWYVTDKQDYLANLAEIGRAYREVIGRHFPAMTLVEVKALVEDRAKVEIEATAVVPD